MMSSPMSSSSMPRLGIANALREGVRRSAFRRIRIPGAPKAERYITTYERGTGLYRKAYADSDYVRREESRRPV